MGLFSTRKSRKSAAAGEGSSAERWVRREVFDGRPYFFNTSREAGRDNVVRLDKPESAMDAEELAARAGEFVWVLHPSEFWTPGRLVKRNKDGSAVVQVNKGATLAVPADGVMGPSRETGQRRQMVPLWPVSWTAMDWDEDDIIKLDGINEASILHNLKKRYQAGSIYTWIGANRSVLLSINPYESLEGMYGEEAMREHKSFPHKEHQWTPPHVYTVANEAYDALVEQDRDQSILVTGESGAGKTEATKYVLEFFAEMVGSDSVEHHIAEKLILTNPLLEAFGNAVTLRNNNSSRFGKFIKVHFSRNSQRIVGASFSNFMLEKTRVVSHQEKERSFHVFYQLLQDEGLRESLGLGGPAEYAYLRHSKASLAGSAADAPALARVLEALESMEFSDEEVASVWKVLAGILNAGNLTFADEEQAGSRVTGSRVLEDRWLEAAAEHWGVAPEDLRRAATSRTVTARGETSVVVLDATAAKDAVDALSKIAYDKLFQLLVRRINDALVPPTQDYFIGLLDIFGFEVLETNGFEQLCINYANEKLQQYHNQHTFDAEEAFYQREEVEYQFLSPRDTQAVLDLLEKRPKGLLVMLDDEGALPGGSEASWLGKAEKEYLSNKLFLTDFRQKFESNLSFQVVHYAGEVRYNASGFVAKNKDTTWRSLYELMASSSDPLVQSMFPANKYVNNTKPVAAQFRANVNGLLDIVKRTESRYIRCIKPNALMRPKDWDAPLIVEQLNYSGVYETVEIRKGGFPFRLTHKQFAFQFGGVNFKHKYSRDALERGDWREICAEILNTNPRLQELSEDIRLGTSTVLYRVSVHKPLTLLRNLAIELALPRAQAYLRQSWGRRYVDLLREAQYTLQQALDTANDITLVRKGIELADETMLWREPKASFLPEYPLHLYERAKHLEKRLMAFEDLQAEMEASSAGKAAEDVLLDLYRTLIDLCKRADTELADVTRTAEQQELYEHLQALIRDSPPGRLDAEARPALESLDRARMQAAKDKSDELGYPSEVIDKIAFILARLDFVDTESRDALEVLDGARMKTVLDEANLYKHTNQYLQEIEELFAKPEKEFVKLELEAAKRLGDKPREIHRRIRLKEIYYDEEGDRFLDTWESGHAREPNDYARGAGLVLCGRTRLAMGMRNWSDKPLASPLSLMPGEVRGGSDDKEMKKVKKMCKKQFLNLQRYMGDKKANAKAAEKAGEAVIRFGWDNPLLRNELFLQLVKQLTANENPESVERGYELLGLAMAQFLPSDGFEDYLVMWVRRNPGPSGDYRPFTSALHRLQFDAKSAARKGLHELRKEFKKLADEGSRFSIHAGAFTGPTGAAKPKPIPKSPLESPQESDVEEGDDNSAGSREDRVLSL